MEVGQAGLALDLLDFQLDLLVAVFRLSVQVGQVELADAALQAFGLDLGTLRLGHHGAVLRRRLVGAQVGRGGDVVPDLLEERIHLFLLLALLAALGETLVLTERHLERMYVQRELRT